jgi:hypothetical protein
MKVGATKGESILISRQLLNDRSFDIGEYVRQRLAEGDFPYDQVEVRGVSFYANDTQD